MDETAKGRKGRRLGAAGQCSSWVGGNKEGRGGRSQACGPHSAVSCHLAWADTENPPHANLQPPSACQTLSSAFTSDQMCVQANTHAHPAPLRFASPSMKAMEQKDESRAWDAAPSATPACLLPGQPEEVKARAWREVTGWGPPWSHLNWQKISAYSAEMLEACRTVTRKVKMLPSFRWSRAASRGPSIVDFSGLSRRRSSGVTAWRREPSDVRSHLPDTCQQLCTAGHELPGPGLCVRAARRSPAQVLLLTSSAEGPRSLICPWPSTMRSSSWDVPERDIPTAGQDSDWNCRGVMGKGA